MAEQHFKDAKMSKKTANKEPNPSTYYFNTETCREIFKQHDRKKSGFLDVNTLTHLAEVVFFLLLNLFVANSVSFLFEINA